MSNTASLKKEYAERIAPALKNQFQYTSSMQIPVLKKIVINQGLGMAVADKKIIDVAINELTAITGQKAVATVSRKDIANFKLYSRNGTHRRRITPRCAHDVPRSHLARRRFFRASLCAEKLFRQGLFCVARGIFLRKNFCCIPRL